jgi:hypothetical protein
MIAMIERRRVAFRGAKGRPFAERKATIALRCVLIAGLLAAMLFAHGCHPHEDNELFTGFIEWIGK